MSFNHQLAVQVAKATSTIPIATFIGSADTGIVRNISRPEGNITGISFDAGIEMQGKHLDLLRQAVPAASRVAVLINRYDWEGAWGRAVLEAGRQSGISIIAVTVEDSAGEEEEGGEGIDPLSKFAKSSVLQRARRCSGQQSCKNVPPSHVPLPLKTTPVGGKA